jgi:heat shock protein HtpX
MSSISNTLKTWTLLAALGGLLVLVGGFLGGRTGMVVALLFAVAMNGFVYWKSDSLALKANGARELGVGEAPRLRSIVTSLAQRAGIPVPRIYIVDRPEANAFATGRDPEHAVVAATTGLLEIMDDSELEGVMAHELGHVRNYDIRLSMIVFGLVVAIGFISDLFLRMTFFGRGNNNNPIVLVFGLVAMLVAPLVASMVQLAVSRQREYLADATGAMTTRHPDALARALLKLEQYGRPMQRQNTSMAHLWIADPLKPGVIDRLFATHPPIGERVRRLTEMGRSF